MTKLLSLLALAVAGAAGATSTGAVTLSPLAAAPASRSVSFVPAARDTADTLWRRARETFSDGEYERAAELFARLRARFPSSTYVGDSFYCVKCYKSFRPVRFVRSASKPMLSVNLVACLATLAGPPAIGGPENKTEPKENRQFSVAVLNMS